MKITVLGCGSSMGVPALKYGWGECDPGNPKNRRTRSSVLIEEAGSSLLVDTSPDLRTQLLACKREDIDAVLFTHAHFDHVGGINELRPLFFSRDSALDVFATKETLAELMQCFPYLFSENPHRIYRGYMKPNEISYGDFEIKGIAGTCFRQHHGYSESLGLRIKNFAYSTDVSELTDEMLECLHGVDVWIVDCLCKGEKRPTHANLSAVLDWVRKINPKMTYLTHMDTSMDYDNLAEFLPEHIRPAYDQLTIEL